MGKRQTRLSFVGSSLILAAVALTACAGHGRARSIATKEPIALRPLVPLPTDTPQPATPATAPMPTRATTGGGFRIELDAHVNALRLNGNALPSGLSVDRYEELLTEELARFPRFGDLVIKLYFPTQESIDSTTANDYFLEVESGGPKILLRADRRGDIQANFSLNELDHEMGHYFTTSANATYWQSILTPDEYQRVAQIEYDASHDRDYGLAANQDAFTEYFSDKMRGGTEFPSGDESVDEQKACSRKRMLEIELSGLNSPADRTRNPFLPLVQTQLDEIHAYSVSPPMMEKAEYIKDAEATLASNEVMVGRISSEEPLMAQVYEGIRENLGRLTEENLSRTSSASDIFTMSGFTKGQAFEDLSKWGAAIFLEREYRAGNPSVIEAYRTKAAEIEDFIRLKDIKARREGVADQIKVEMRVRGSSTPAAKLLAFFSAKAKM